MIDITKIYK